MVQILTGVIMVFTPEIEDSRYNLSSVSLNIKFFVENLKTQDAANSLREPRLIYTTSKKSTHFDVYFTMRILVNLALAQSVSMEAVEYFRTA